MGGVIEKVTKGRRGEREPLGATTFAHHFGTIPIELTIPIKNTAGVLFYTSSARRDEKDIADFARRRRKVDMVRVRPGCERSPGNQSNQ